MARKPTGTEVVDWEKEMEAQAEIAAAATRASGGGGKFFSMRAGQLSFGGNPMPGNQMAVVILGAIIENSYYDAPFDPDTPAAPKCFAFGTDEHEMEPHSAVDAEDYFERQNDTCTGCPMNAWGSARTGKGKACSNVMRLAMIPAGVYKSKGGRNAGLELELIEDEDEFKSAEVAYMKLPVMSVKNYTAFVKALALDVRRPPHGVFANVVVEPDQRSQFSVQFELIDKAPTSLLPILMGRHKTVMDEIDFPYSPPQEREAAPEPKANKKLTRAR